MRNGLPFSKPRVRLYGATGEAQNYLGAAYNLLYKVRQFCGASGTPVFAMQHSLPDGAMVQAAILGNEEIVSCYPPSYQREVPELPKEKFPLRGAPGPVFLHESLLPSFRHQGLVGVSILEGYSGFTQVDDPWPGQASRSFRRVFDKSAGERDERAVYNGPASSDYRFGPHAISYSKFHKVHVQVSKMFEVGSVFMPSTVFVAGVPVLQSSEIEFVGARLYREFLAFAFVLYQGDQAHLCFSTKSIASISADRIFTPSDLETYTHIAVLGTPDETIVNYHPSTHEALFLSGGQRVEVVNGVTEYLFDYSFGRFDEGVPELIEQQVGVCGRRSQTRTFSSTLNISYDHIKTETTINSIITTTNDFNTSYSLILPIPTGVSSAVAVSGAPIWCGYSEEGDPFIYRLYGTASHSYSGAFSRERTLSDYSYFSGPSDYGLIVSRTDTNEQPLEVQSSEAEIRVNRLDWPAETTVRTIPCGSFNAQSGTSSTLPTANRTPSSRLFAPNGARYVEHVYSSVDVVGRNFGVTLSNGAGSWVIEAESPYESGTYSYTCSSTINNSFTLIDKTTGEYPPETTTVVERQYLTKRDGAYQLIHNEAGAFTSSYGTANVDYSLLAPVLWFSVHTNYEFVNVPPAEDRNATQSVYMAYPATGYTWTPSEPQMANEAGNVRRTHNATWTATLGLTLSADVRHNLFVGNRLYGCLFDAVADGHILSEFGMFVSPFSPTNTPLKNVFFLSSATATDITPQILNARPDADGSARPPQQSVDWNTSDVFILKGMI